MSRVGGKITDWWKQPFFTFNIVMAMTGWTVWTCRCMTIPLVQCVVPMPVSNYSLMSFLDQQKLTKPSSTWFDGIKTCWCPCCASIFSSILASSSLICVLDSELPKRFSSATALVLPVILLDSDQQRNMAGSLYTSTRDSVLNLGQYLRTSCAHFWAGTWIK